MPLLDLSLSADAVEQLARALDALANTALATPLWRVDSAQALGAVLECDSSSVIVVTPAVRAFVDASRVADAHAPVERRRRGTGIWARSGAHPRAGCDAVGMTARSSESETIVSVVCEFDTPLDDTARQRRLAVLRLAYPVFAAAVWRRFGRRSDDGNAHPLLSTSARLLLDAMPDGVACLDDDGQMVWRNHALDRLLSGEPEADRLRRELATTAQGLAVRAWGRRHAPMDDFATEPVGGEFRTLGGRYWLRLLRAEEGDDALVVAIVTRLGVAAADDALDTMRARYRLTQRETEVARLLLDGRPNSEVAHALGVSPPRARHHTQRLLSKLGVESRDEIHLLFGMHRSDEMRIPRQPSRMER